VTRSCREQDLAKISATVNTFNSVSHNLDNESRRGFAEQLAKAMEPKITEGDATDCSRLAWLLIKCDRGDRALQIVERGLRLDPDSEYCQNLKIGTCGPGGPRWMAKRASGKRAPRAIAEAALLRRSTGERSYSLIRGSQDWRQRRQVAKFRRRRPADSSCFPCMLVRFSQTKRKP
jgi:hypothetical protein